MEHAIDVVIVAQQEEIDALNLLLSNSIKSGEIKIAHATTNFDHAANMMRSVNHPVVLIRSKNFRSQQTIKFMEFLNEYEIKYICICREVGESFEMLKLGAADMIIRKDSELLDKSLLLAGLLKTKIKQAYARYFNDNERVLKKEFGGIDKIVVMGSSTGGTETVLSILKKMPENAPPILIVQHMPPVFTRLYAERLNNSCKLSCWEGRQGDELKRGLVVIAPGDYQMTIRKFDNRYFVECTKGGLVNGHCPSVDVLFKSAAQVLADKAVGVILTGMGNDGASGLLEMRRRGAYTIGQDAESSIVYGMPKAAYELDAVIRQCSLKDIPEAILNAL